MVVRSSSALRQAGQQSHPALAPTRRLPPRTRPHLEQRLLLTVLFIPLSFTSLAAQDPLTAGDKVRVTTEEERIVGYWISLDDNQLTLNTDRDSNLVLPLASLAKIEVSRGQKSRAGKGALIGAAVGVTAGVITGLALGGGCIDSSCISDAGAAAIVAVVFGAGGTLLGAVTGAFIKTDRWETVPLDRISVSLTPRGGGLEVSAKFVF